MSNLEKYAVDKPDSVWKVGSRWSYDGNARSSILDIFRRHNVVFANANHGRFREINPGNLIAVSDGKVIVALGRVNGSVTTLDKLNLPFTEQEAGRVDPAEPIPAVRTSFIDLKEEDFIDYRIGAIHRVRERAEQLIELYQSYDSCFKENQGFEINARSCTLLTNPNKPDEVLWKDRLHLQVPVYQRSYSWGETEIRRLLSDLLTAFWGRLGRAPQEAMFIGTMQLSAAVRLDITDAQIQEIIDGQQRCTTLILTLKALELLIPNASIWKAVSYRNRLSTTVDRGVQQNYLVQALDASNPEEVPDELNPYQKALKIISEELSQEPDWQKDEERIESFVSYLLSRVYFVVIETRASLSKTLQIFDAINTSGMDLNGGDVFKIRYYEYLKEVHNKDDSVFGEILALYEKIARRNKALGKELVHIENVLSLAQQIVITESGMGVSPRSLAATTFFERFFDTALSINRWDGFNKDVCDKVELTIQKLDQLVELLFSWEEWAGEPLSPESEMMAHFIWHTRYGRYYLVVQMYRYRFNPTKEKLEEFILGFTKLLSILSVRYQKVTNEGHNAVYGIMKKLCAPNEMVDHKELIQHMDVLRQNQKESLKYALMENNIAHIPKAKSLLCRMDAMLDELEHAKKSSSEVISADLTNLIFHIPIDIEHIESANHECHVERQKIHDEWGDELHRLGNLIVLEYSINRSISNKDYSAVKRPRYLQSDFRSVKDFSDKNERWSLQQATERKGLITDKLASYLCD